MNITDLQPKGYYKAYTPLQHISVDTTGEIVLVSPPYDTTLSFSIYSNKNGESELDVICNNLLLDSAKIYSQPLQISLSIPKQSTIQLKFTLTDDEVFVSNIALDNTRESYYSSLNTHSVSEPLPISTKTNAFVFVVDQNFIGFLQLFLLTLRRHNSMDNTSLVGLIPQGDTVAKQFLIDNNIHIIEYEKTSDLKTAKQIIYMDAARLCTSNYLCLIDLDMIVLGDIEQPFNILHALSPNTMLLCLEQSVSPSSTLDKCFNNECLIYPMNENYTYLEAFEPLFSGASVINNGLSYAPRKVLLQFSNYLRTYSTYFRKWIHSNEAQCGWAEQGIFNIAICNNFISLLHPSYNVQANTQQEKITKEQDIYYYDGTPIKILHLNGSDRSKYHEYLRYGIDKYGWDILSYMSNAQIEKLLPEYFDKEVSYDCLDELNNLNLLCYSNKLDLLCKLTEHPNLNVITSNSLVDSIQVHSGRKSQIVSDFLSFLNSSDLSEYEALVINDAIDQYRLRAIVELLTIRNISIPVYCKIHYSVRTNKILPNLQNSNVRIKHLITTVDKMYEYYFIKVQKHE